VSDVATGAQQEPSPDGTPVWTERYFAFVAVRGVALA